LTACSGVISWLGLALVSTAAGTLVICRTTTKDACDSLATGRVASGQLDRDQCHHDSQLWR